MHLQCNGSDLGADLEDLDPDAYLDLGFGSKHIDSTQLQPIYVLFNYFLKTPCRKRCPANLFFLTAFLKERPKSTKRQ